MRVKRKMLWLRLGSVGLVLWLCTGTSFAGHLSGVAAKVYAMQMSAETSGTMVAEYLLEQAGVSKEDALRAIASAIDPLSSASLEWALSVKGMQCRPGAECAVVSFVLQKNKVSDAWELFGYDDLPGKKMIELLRNDHLTTAYPVLRLPEELIPFTAGVSGTLNADQIAQLELMLDDIQSTAGRAKHVSASYIHWLLWIYANQTGKTDILEKWWRQGSWMSWGVQCILPDIGEDSSLVEFGLRCVKDVREGLVKQGTAFPERFNVSATVLFLRAAAKNPAVSDVIIEWLRGEGPGPYARYLPELLREVDLSRLKPGELKSMRDRIQRIADALDCGAAKTGL